MTLRQLLVSIIPPALLGDPELKPIDVAVYIGLSSFPLDGLSVQCERAGIPYETFRRSTLRLIQYEWAYAEMIKNRRVVIPSMPFSVEEDVADELFRIRDSVPFVGEWLMKCILDLIVQDGDYGDNLRPSWLVSGEGSGRYELDRLYRYHKVAFEFQGPQHFKLTDHWHDQAELQEQMERDRVKRELCAQQGIRLIYVTADNLSLSDVWGKVEGLLPLIPVRKNRPIVQMVDNLCRSYVNHVKRREKAES